MNQIDIYIYQIFKLDHPAADPSAVLPSCGWKGAPLEEHLAQITELRREEDTAVICSRPLGIETDTQKVL
jgi:hypothetical protein